MNGWQIPWVASRVLVDDGRVLVVDKPSGLPVHGGDGRLGDVVSRLGRWLEARGEDGYLGVHQRLDQDASGALVFVRDPHENAAVARDFEAHRLERHYVAVVEGPLEGQGRFEDQLAHERGRSRVVASGGKKAVARYRVVERRGARALVHLVPETGRTHQLRAQLARRGAPICGDRLYGGDDAPRLMLHASRLVVPSLHLDTEAPEPAVFRDWLAARPPSLGSNDALSAALGDAMCLRYGLDAQTDACRLADDAADGVPGLVVDRYADWMVLSATTPEALERRAEIAEVLLSLGARGVYDKSRPRADLRRLPGELAPGAPLAGRPAPSPLVVREGPCRLTCRLDEGLSTGVFVDQRDTRRRILDIAAGRRVLNLFAYTGAFSVAAGLSGATEVVSVDLSRRALGWLDENLKLNRLDPAAHRLLCEDALKYLARARRRGERFGLVILDPPTFATRGRGTFRVPADYASAAENALSLLEPRGTLIAVTNHRATTRGELRRLLHRAAENAGRAIRQMKDLFMPPDFRHRPRGTEPTKTVLLRVS